MKTQAELKDMIAGIDTSMLSKEQILALRHEIENATHSLCRAEAIAGIPGNSAFRWMLLDMWGNLFTTTKILTAK